MYLKQLFSLTFLFLTIAVSAFAGDEEVASIYPQPDSPLQLSKVAPRWEKTIDEKGRDWNILSLNFVLQNISNKAIRAYTIRVFKGSFNKDVGSIDFAIMPTKESLLKPNQIINQSTVEASEKNSDGSDVEQKNLKLAVDFVEFTDGSTWGQDLSESAQRLAGLRAGAKTAQEFLLKAEKQNGLDSFPKAFDDVKDLLPPEGQSQHWKSGFKSGVNNIKSRMERLYEKEGGEAVVIDLQKPLFLPT